MVTEDMYLLGDLSMSLIKPAHFFQPLPYIPDIPDIKYKFNANIFFCQYKNAK